jgi:hypothetical protein
MTKNMSPHQRRLNEELLGIVLVGVLSLIVALLLSRVKTSTIETETRSTTDQVILESSQQDETEGGRKND